MRLCDGYKIEINPIFKKLKCKIIIYITTFLQYNYEIHISISLYKYDEKY